MPSSTRWPAWPPPQTAPSAAATTRIKMPRCAAVVRLRKPSGRVGLAFMLTTHPRQRREEIGDMKSEARLPPQRHLQIDGAAQSERVRENIWAPLLKSMN